MTSKELTDTAELLDQLKDKIGHKKFNTSIVQAKEIIEVR